jgi:AraC-like DNA-binding protein
MQSPKIVYDNKNDGDNMSDPLSEVLDLIGVQSSVYFQKDFCAPWGMRVENTGFAQFHILVRGVAVVEYDGTHHELSTGDVLLFPKGASHTISDNPHSAAVSGREVMEAFGRGDPLFTSSGRATRMVCGHFEYDFGHKHPLIQELPTVIFIRSESLPATYNLLGLLNILISESNLPGPGSAVLIRKLSDALLVAILRAYFEINKGHIGFHNGLRDERIARALSAIHDQNWSELGLEKLSALVGMSRSAFAQSFKATVGHSPKEYSTRWKLLKASAMLLQSDCNIEQIAFDSGYASSTAFSRAFNGMFGVTPGQYRKDERSDP